MCRDRGDCISEAIIFAKKHVVKLSAMISQNSTHARDRSVTLGDRGNRTPSLISKTGLKVLQL